MTANTRHMTENEDYKLTYDCVLFILGLLSLFVRLGDLTLVPDGEQVYTCTKFSVGMYARRKHTSLKFEISAKK